MPQPPTPDTPTPSDADLPRETAQPVQDDAPEQAQSVAEDARNARTSALELGESTKAPDGLDDEESPPDLIDHMRQMTQGGILDMSAYRGERNDDDEEDSLGPDEDARP